MDPATAERFQKLELRIAALEDFVTRPTQPKRKYKPRALSAPAIDCLRVMFCHQDLALNATSWARNGKTFSPGVVSSLVEHGLVEETAPKYFRITRKGIDFIEGMKSE